MIDSLESPASRPPSGEVRRGAARRNRLGGDRRTAAALSSVLAVILLLAGGCKNVSGGGGGGTGRPSALSSCPPMGQDNHGNDLDCVRALQNALFILGEAVAVDGSFGPQTTAAVRRFQSSKGLGVDGVAGPSTLTALESALPGDSVFITASGVFTCDDLFDTCTFYFDHPTTRKIYSALDGPAGMAFACPYLKDLRAVAVCGILGSLGTQVVRETASTARGNSCLAVDLGAIRAYNDDGKYCRK